jgi:hypothetical protein
MVGISRAISLVYDGTTETDSRTEANPMRRPDPTEYAPFYAGYIARVPESDALAVLEQQLLIDFSFFRSIGREAEQRIHPPFKWTIREVAGHLADAERVFGFRLFHLLRRDPNPLPAFDEMEYARVADYNQTPLAEWAEELSRLRLSHLQLLRNHADAEGDVEGIVSGQRITARALAFIMAGHVRHHMTIVRERLGVA